MFESKLFRVFLVPAGVFLSVIFGGGYASGREITAYISSNGAAGGIYTSLVIAAIFSLVLTVSIEIARCFRVYDYRLFSKVLLGKAWFVYEAALLLGMAVGLALATTSAGATLEQHFGISPLTGTAMMLLTVVAMTYLGRRIIELSMAASAAMLLLFLFTLMYLVLADSSDVVSQRIASDSPGSELLGNSVTYAVVTTAYVPLIIFMARDVRTRAESIMAGVFAGLVGAAPALLLHLVFIAGMPDVLDEALPNYYMVGQYAGPLFLHGFVLILFILILQTGVGILQGFIERIDGWSIQRNGRPMTAGGHAVVAMLTTSVSLGLSTVGVIALVAGAYTVLSAVFLFSFTIPLFTWGLYRLKQAGE